MAVPFPCISKLARVMNNSKTETLDWWMDSGRQRGSIALLFLGGEQEERLVGDQRPIRLSLVKHAGPGHDLMGRELIDTHALYWTMKMCTGCFLSVLSIYLATSLPSVGHFLL